MGQTIFVCVCATSFGNPQDPLAGTGDGNNYAPLDAILSCCVFLCGCPPRSPSIIIIISIMIIISIIIIIVIINIISIAITDVFVTCYQGSWPVVLTTGGGQCCWPVVLIVLASGAG
jgi:hypothetical protein